MKLNDTLRNAEKKYYPMNYWGWLENINPNMVNWQIDQMDSAGVGGYVAHARGGLEIPYMGERWMNSVKAMIERGKKNQMLTIIDDEDGWPSGFGAGEVTAEGEAYWQKWLKREMFDASERPEVNNPLGYYQITDNKITALDSASDAVPGHDVIVISYLTNNYYTDMINPAAVDKFIGVSYQRYYDAFKDEFDGGYVYGMFSDEPQLARSHCTWSDVLPGEFKKIKGYEIYPHLPALFYETDGYKKFRYDYWDVVNQLFIHNFAEKIYDWCERHNTRFTGHSVNDENLESQIHGSGGTMEYYEYEHIPGIDWLSRSDVHNVLLKQVVSVSKQLGKERILSEMFGCAGWNASFEDLKRIGEWHCVSGVDLMLQHLGLYSLKGSRKREYPPSIFYHQPWWPEFAEFNLYFARVSKLLAESRQRARVLVLHPLKSGWTLFNIGDRTAARELSRVFTQITDTLIELNYDFHYGDENIMRKHGSVSGNKMIVGDYAYEMVVLPYCTTLDRSTIRLINKYYENGGKILTIGDVPRMVEGVNSAETAEFFNSLPNCQSDRQSIETNMEKYLPPEIKIVPADGSPNADIYTCACEYNGETVYYIFNKNADERREFRIKLPDGGGRFYLLDIMTLVEEPVGIDDSFSFEPAQSMFLIQDRAAPAREVAPRNANRRVNTIVLPKIWDIVSGDLNMITLDICDYRVDGGEWTGQMPVIEIQDELIRLGRAADAELKFFFDFIELADGEIFMAIEQPEAFVIIINGRGIEPEDYGWFVDQSIRKIRIGPYLREGVNEIILKRHFYCSEYTYKIKNDPHIHEAESNRVTVETELESIYILGGFSVVCGGKFIPAERGAVWYDGGFRLAKPKKQLPIDDLLQNGYPFFSGRIKLSACFEMPRIIPERKYFLKFKKPSVTAANVFVNGSFVKMIGWAPYEADVTKYLSDGKNMIELELVTSRRNLFGPHHHEEGELYGVGPGSYYTWTWRDYGAKTRRSVWDERYCFVKFGIEGDITVEEYTS